MTFAQLRPEHKCWGYEIKPYLMGLRAVVRVFYAQGLKLLPLSLLHNYGNYFMAELSWPEACRRVVILSI